MKEMIIGLDVPPTHLRCRFTTIPYTGDEYYTKISKDVKTKKYNYVRGDITYEEWYRKFTK